MTLVDTSVWIDHFEHVDARLLDLVANQSVAMHPFVIGELAAGSIKNRGITLGELALQPQAPIAKEDEVHRLLESHRLWSTGLGWVDPHLLPAAFLIGLETADLRPRHEDRRSKTGHRAPVKLSFPRSDQSNG
jgi:predicted nucleic acid-binding protein